MSIPTTEAAAAGPNQQTTGGAAFAIGLGFALVTHFKSLHWLAKDLVWVLPDARCGSLESTRTWLSTYNFQDGYRSREPFGRAGRIQQALVLDTRSARYDNAEILVEGESGQLPKLDMFWLVKVLADTYLQAPTGLQGSPGSILSGLDKLGWNTQAKEHLAKLATMSEFVWRQAVGLPTGPHAAFKDVGADAVTLRLTSKARLLSGVREEDQEGGWVQVDQLVAAGQVVEMIVRSCSNLLERFHHSYTLYLQTSNSHFVTVDTYIVPLAALLLALLLQAGAVKAKVDEQYMRQAPSAAGLAAHVHGWLGSIQAVLLTQALAAAAGIAARSAAVAGGQPPLWLADTAQQCWGEWRSGGWLKGGAGEEGGCGALLSGGLLLAAVVGQGAWAVFRLGRGKVGATRTVAGAAEAGGPVADDGPQWAWEKVQVVVLSDLAAGMAAVGCINWALSFFWLLLLVPMAVVAHPCRGRPGPRARPPRPSRAASSQLLTGLAITVVTSPLLLLALLRATTSPSTSLLDALQWWLCDSNLVGYLVVWMMYLPVWLLSGCIYFC